MNLRKPKIILAIIVILAAFLRFYQLGNNPPSLTWDEAAWGYNAYSLGIDGRDEFGKFLPIQYLESFGDFKPPVYVYLAILPIKIFGLNEFATRFPSAFLGTLTVFITYFLTKRILFFQYSPPRSPFGSPRARLAAQRARVDARRCEAGHLGGVAKRLPRGEMVALLSTFFLAISPWHINLSRAAFEANVATFFLVLGVFLFLKGLSRGVASFPPGRWNAIDTSGFWLSLSAVSFVLSMYTFNTARIVAPLFVLALAIGFRKQLLGRKKEALIAVLIGLTIFVPLGTFLLSPQARLRFDEVNIFSDIGVIDRTNREIANDGGAFWSRMLHNRRFAYAVEYVRHYFDHFNPTFLFIKGDGNPKFSTQDVGQLYLWDLPFLIGGILFLFRRREGYWWIIPVWLLLGIVPAATARETPHALRIETTLPTFQILVAYGLVNIIKEISNIKYQIYLLFFLFFIFNFLYYIHGYYVHYPREYSGEWQYGYKESIEYVKSVQDKYDQILITTAMGRPYIYYALFTKTDLETFRKTAIVKRDAFGFVKVSGFLKYRFADNLSSIKVKTKKTLYVDTPGRVHPKGDVLKKIYLLNGEVALVAYRL